MSISLEQLQRILNEGFGEPFLKKGSVVASFEDNEDGTKELNIQIGRRDITINEDGEVTSSGCMI